MGFCSHRCGWWEVGGWWTSDPVSISIPDGHQHESVLHLGGSNVGAIEGEGSTAGQPGQLVFLGKNFKKSGRIKKFS